MVEELDPALAEIRDLYFQECTELLDDSGGKLTLLQNNLQESNSEDINAIFRAIHSVKGGGGAWGLTEVTNFAHIFESTLGEIRDGNITLDKNSIGILIYANDILVELVEAAQQGFETGDGHWKSVANQLQNLVSSKEVNEDTFSNPSINDDLTKRYQVVIIDGRAVLQLIPVLDLSVAIDIQEIFLSLYGNVSEIIVNGANVERVTTPCIQVFIAYASDLKNTNCKLKVIDASRPFIHSFIELGFKKEIDMMTR